MLRYGASGGLGPRLGMMALAPRQWRDTGSSHAARVAAAAMASHNRWVSPAFAGSGGAKRSRNEMLERAKLWMVAGLGVVLLAAAPLAGEAGQIASADFFGLRRGMSESEILLRAGVPDLVTTPGFETIEVRAGKVRDGKSGKPISFETFRRSRTPVIERWHYVPGPREHDPYLTVITFKGGEVWELERTKVFSRASLPAVTESAPESDRESRTSEYDVRVERLDKTLEAAESYAATRRRLKEEIALPEAEPGAARGSESPIYRRVQPDGSTYYGDAPPGTSFEIIDVD